MLHDELAKYSPNLTADGLTSQVCSISLPGTCYNYVRRERTGCVVPDFPIVPLKVCQTLWGNRAIARDVTVT